MNLLYAKLKRNLKEAVESGKLHPSDRRVANKLIENWKNPTTNQFAFIHKMIQQGKQIRITPDNNYNKARIIKYDKEGKVISDETKSRI